MIDLRSLQPWDEGMVLDSLARTHRLVVCHEAVEAFGVGAEIAARMADIGFDELDGPIGGDIADLKSRGGLAHYREFAEIIHRVFRRIEASDKPTIAAVNGFALGGGTELILATDIRILADNARLGLPEITLGLFPGAGGTQRIIRQIPPCRARELMFTGDQIGAEEAVAIGLANRVVPRAELMSAATATAQKIAQKSPLVLKLLKRALLHGADMPLSAALPYEQAMIGLVLDSADAHEGCAAFLEKRKPSFTGE